LLFSLEHTVVPWRRLFLTAMLHAAVLGQAWAFDGARLKDYHHDIWSAKDGAPGDITTMTQTRDGWIWLGTGSGLYRFDGARFEKFVPPPGQQLFGSNITNLWAADNGDLWISYLTGGMSLLHQGRLSVVAEDKADSPVRAYNMEMDRDGSVWAAAFRGLCHYVDGKWRLLGPESGFPGPQAKSVFLDQAGRLWVSNGLQLYQLDRASGKFVAAGIAGNADHLAQSPDGRLWLGDKDGWRLMPAPAGGWTPPPAGQRPHSARLGLFDRDGNHWAARCPTGICRTPAATVGAADRFDAASAGAERFDQPWQVSSLTTNNVLEDREGNIWIGTQGGVERFRRNKLTTVDGLPPDNYYYLVKDGQGQLWGGTRPGNTLFKLDAQGASAVDRTHDELAIGVATDGSLLLADRHRLERRVGGTSGASVASVFTPLPPGADGKAVDNHPLVVMGDADNAWVGITPRGVYRWDGDRWTDASTIGLPTGGHLAMTMAQPDSLWAGFRNGHIVHYDHGKVDKYQLPAEGFGIVKLIDAADGVVAAGERGLAVLQDGRFRLVRAADSEPLSGVSGIVADERGDRWINGGKGVLHVAAADWTAMLARPDAMLRYELIGALDGYPGAASTTFYKPSAVRAADGALWFVATGGVARLDTARLRRNLVAPPVLVQDLTTASGVYSPAAVPAQLPAGAANLHIRYTALSYTMPERVRFRYRLDGFDAGWQDAGTRREAFYTGLPPGQYRFRVRASNEDGIDSTDDAVMDFAIAPTFTQTPLFQLLCALAALAALYAAYAWRMRRLARHYGEQMQVRLAERERIARTLHDTLLQSMHGLLLSFHGVSVRLPADGEAQTMMKRILDRADGVMDESRQLIMKLRMTTAYGADLNGALAVVGRSLQETFARAFQMTVAGTPGALDAAPAEEIYYIAREALFNAFQHADARQVTLALDYGADHFSLSVRDDGKGMDEEVLRSGQRPGHWGLAGMRERGASIGAALTVDSVAGAGTEVLLKMPVRLLYRSAPRLSLWRRLRALPRRSRARNPQ
jgi:signal transduction histidine kinase/ligand-binding sensor domain-containing protein